MLAHSARALQPCTYAPSGAQLHARCRSLSGGACESFGTSQRSHQGGSDRILGISSEVILSVAGSRRGVRVQAALLWPLHRRGLWFQEDAVLGEPGTWIPEQYLSAPRAALLYLLIKRSLLLLLQRRRLSQRGVHSTVLS